MIGRASQAILDLTSSNPNNAVVLIGEVHTHVSDFQAYNRIIEKEKNIIDYLVHSFGRNNTYLYSETPAECLEQALINKTISSCEIVRYGFVSKIKTKLSSINVRDRYKGQCDAEYADDILSIFTNQSINCIIVVIGLAHLLQLKHEIQTKSPNTKTVMVNAASSEQITQQMIKELKNTNITDIDYLLETVPFYDELLELPEPLYQLETVPFYDKPLDLFKNISSYGAILGLLELLEQVKTVPVCDELLGSFKVEVLTNAGGDKVYKCPSCKTITGTLAPLYPGNTSYFSHSHDCPNKNKFPKE